MGGAAGVNLLLGMVRTKFAAVLIGVGGVGLISNYSVIQGLISTISGLGIQSSAVREIVSAVAKNDEDAIGRAVLSLRRICWFTGFLGGGLLIILSPFISQWTFGNKQYAMEIALLGIVVLFGNLSGGQMSLIQGARRIGDMARINIINAFVSTIVSIGLYAWLGLHGIIPTIISIAFVQLVVTWWFARRIIVRKVEMTWMESFQEAGGMVRFGLVFMWNSLLLSLVGYATNALITHQISLHAVGIYSAAFALSGMFVNFVLNAMGADYYPRLTASAPNCHAMKRMVNEQTEIGLLLAVPGLLATLTFSPWIIYVFYTQEFLPAVDLLQWFVLGCLGRVISWPLGLVVLALGKGKLFFSTETSFNILHVLMIYCGLIFVGLEGVAVAFVLLYILYAIAIYIVARYLIDFKYSSSCLKLLYILLPIVMVNFIAVRTMSLWPATIFGALATILVALLCLKNVIKRIGIEHRLSKIILKIPGTNILFYRH